MSILAQVKAITVSLHILRQLDLQQVIDLSTSIPLILMVPEDIRIMELAGSGFFDEACVAQLAINFDSHTSKKGAFKIAFFGTCSVPLQAALDCNRVCAKACFTEDQGKAQTCAPSDQVRKLLMELRCLSWAHTLMELVYSFIESFSDDIAIAIPDVAFVAAALAIGQNMTKEKGNVLLLEQPI